MTHRLPIDPNVMPHVPLLPLYNFRLIYGRSGWHIFQYIFFCTSSLHLLGLILITNSITVSDHFCYLVMCRLLLWPIGRLAYWSVCRRHSDMRSLFLGWDNHRLTHAAQGGADGSVRLLLLKNPACCVS